MNKLKAIALGLLIPGLAFAQMGGGPGMSTPPVGDDPTFTTLDVTGASTLASLDVTGTLTAGTFSAADISAGTLADARLSSNVPLLNVSNVFTASPTVSENVAHWFMQEADAAANNGLWSLTANGAVLSMRAWDDAVSGNSSALRLLRTGTTIDQIELNATLIDVNAAVDVSGSFTSAGNTATVSGGSPRFQVSETDAAVDNRIWEFIASAEQLSLRAVNDAFSLAGDIILVNRTGTTIDSINISATDVTINSATAWRDVDSAGNGGGPLGLAYARTNSSGTLQRSTNVSSVTNDAGTGAWTVNFTANTFNADPVCSVSTVGAGMAYQDGPWSSSSVGVETRDQTGTLTDLGFTITCLSTD